MAEQEFFGIRFVPDSDRIYPLLADNWFTCVVCGVHIEFSGVVDHAKYHKWQQYVQEQQDLRIAILEKKFDEVTGGDVIDMTARDHH